MRSERATYDHVIELRNVTAAMSLADVSELVTNTLQPPGSASAAAPDATVTLLDVKRVDDNSVIVVCSNRELSNCLMQLTSSMLSMLSML